MSKKDARKPKMSFSQMVFAILALLIVLTMVVGALFPAF